MEIEKIIEWGFLSLLTGVGSFVVKFLWDISKSVSQLNIQVASILERTAIHSESIENHESRLERLELKKTRVKS